jgi:hypothetical protein
MYQYILQPGKAERCEKHCYLLADVKWGYEMKLPEVWYVKGSLNVNYKA